MNHLFSPLSWSRYFEGCLLALILYYLFIGIRHYSADLRNLAKKFSGNSDQSGQLPAALLYEEPERSGSQQPISAGQINYDNLPDSSMQETDALIGQLKTCISQAGQKPFSPAALIPQLKSLFKEHPQLKNSPHRAAINELVVAECERTGTALLNEDEVDQWWSD